ncbi:MAG: hypothetical protein U9N02_04595 [Campylobacterota bacterium]|nr:hypothetical protein [Campylobacterota bacterium]
MKLVNILALIQAKLVNEPFVDAIENIILDARKIKRGDLFIAFNESDIEEAIFNGAYAIVFDKPTQITDSEIAWIKVQDLESTLKKLLRFRLIEKEIQSYESNEIILRLAQQIITQSDFITIDGRIKEIFLPLWNVEKGSTILFSSSLTDATIFTDVKSIPNIIDNSIEIVEQTLFETSFTYSSKFYERQFISPYFIPYLDKLFGLFKTLDINFRLKKFTQLKHFEAVFINKNIDITEFGLTDKVIIFEPNITLINSQIKFLEQNASWAKIIYIIPKNETISYDIKNIIKYKNENDIKKILKNSDFNFALVVNSNKSILNKKITPQPALF